MMKKIASVLAATALLLSLCACGAASAQPTGTSAPAGPAGALEVLENIWALYGDDERFSVYGGNPKENYEDNIWDAPGVYDMADENMSYNLLIPADRIGQVDDVASMTHGMMANNFNSAVFHVTAGNDVKAFADALYQSITGNMWICGMPERAVVASIGEYVVMAYGVSDPMASFLTHLAEAYPDATIYYNEPLV